MLPDESSGVPVWLGRQMEQAQETFAGQTFSGKQWANKAPSRSLVNPQVIDLT